MWRVVSSRERWSSWRKDERNGSHARLGLQSGDESKYSDGEPSAGMKGTRAACLAYVDLRNLVWSSCLSKYDSAVRIRDGISGLLQVLIMLAAQPLSLKPGSLSTSHAISCLMAYPSASQWNRGADGRPCSSGHSSAPPPFRRSCSRRQHQ